MANRKKVVGNGEFSTRLKDYNFIENCEENGIDYDFRKIYAFYRKLGIPDDYDFIPWDVITTVKYFVMMSSRSIGKTTNVLLLGMVFNALYGTLIEYIRVTEDEIKASVVEKLFSTINGYKNGEYVKILTGGKYNSTFYHWRQVYYCSRDQECKIIEIAPEPFLHFSSIEGASDLKSGYNAPKGDILILDEFLGPREYSDLMYHFFDHVKTIIRDRMSPIIFMLSNCLDVRSLWFEELEISSYVRRLHAGESKVCTTEKGTKIYVSAIEPTEKKKKIKHIVNSLFFGFKNPKMASITGEGELFITESYPHFTFKQTGREEFFKNVVIEYGITRLRVSLVYSEELGKHLEVCFANGREYEDDIVLSLKPSYNQKYYYGFGPEKLQKLIGKMASNKKIYFSSNEVGSVWDKYLNDFLANKRK